MSIFAKLAGQHGIPVFQIVLVRSAIVAAFAAAKLAHDDVPGEPLLGHRRWLLLLRGMCGFGAGRWAFRGTVDLIPLISHLICAAGQDSGGTRVIVMVMLASTHLPSAL